MFAIQQVDDAMACKFFQGYIKPHKFGEISPREIALMGAERTKTDDAEGCFNTAKNSRFLLWHLSNRRSPRSGVESFAKKYWNKLMKYL
jgi:hypothetical protein